MPAVSEAELAAGIENLRQLVEAGDPDIIEDLNSLSESSPYVIRVEKSRGLMRCERCRAFVISVPEYILAPDPGDPPGSRRWERAIWEPETGRKHTLRRCEAMRP
jgi:hypothetical protein